MLDDLGHNVVLQEGAIGVFYAELVILSPNIWKHSFCERHNQ